MMNNLFNEFLLNLSKQQANHPIELTIGENALNTYASLSEDDGKPEPRTLSIAWARIRANSHPTKF
jgi:hypothetical protein